MNRYYKKVKASSDRYEFALRKLEWECYCDINLHSGHVLDEVNACINYFAHKYASREITNLRRLFTCVHIAMTEVHAHPDETCAYLRK